MQEEIKSDRTAAMGFKSESLCKLREWDMILESGSLAFEAEPPRALENLNVVCEYARVQSPEPLLSCRVQNVVFMNKMLQVLHRSRATRSLRCM